MNKLKSYPKIKTRPIGIIGSVKIPSRVNIQNKKHLTLEMDGLTADYLLNDVFNRALNNPDNSLKDCKDIMEYKIDFKKQFLKQL